MRPKINHCHSLATKKDFTQDQIAKKEPLAMAVIHGGLTVCKHCGEHGADTDKECWGAPAVADTKLPTDHSTNKTTVAA